jgi:signal transduction histidine kinase/ABC-type uncharacterized transport system substrate-binding protein/ActR/RegA family two-component response regulator
VKNFSCIQKLKKHYSEQHKKNCFKFMAVLFLLFFFMLAYTPGQPLAQAASKQVLFISSYSLDWDGFPKQLEGVKSELDDSVEIKYIFMYGKFNTPEQAKAKAHANVQFMLKVVPKFDLVIASNDLALEFVMENRKKYFKDIPIVFEGINSEDFASLSAMDPTVTGIVETFEFKDTINAAHNLFPNATKVVGVSDDTETGKGSSKQFMNQKKYFPQLEFSILNTSVLTQQEIAAKLESYDEKTILLFLVFTKDKNGNFYNAREGTQFVAKHAKIPIFKSDELGIMDGVLGGKLLSYKEMGKSTGRIVMLILNGTPPESIPMEKVPLKYIFNKDVLEKFKLSPDKLPPHSIILNPSPSFFEKNQEQLRPLIAAVAFLILLIILAVGDSWHRRILYRKLSKTQNQLAVAEKSLLAAVKDTDIFYWEYYPQSSSAVLGNMGKKFAGLPTKLNDFPHSWRELNLIHPDDLPEFTRIHQEILDGKDSSVCQLRTLQEGKYCWEKVKYTVIQRDEQGKTFKVIGTALSIDKEKELELRYNEQLNNRQVLIARAKGYCKLNVTNNKVVEMSNVAAGYPYGNFSSANSLLREMKSRVVADSQKTEKAIVFLCTGLLQAFQQGNTHWEFEILYAFTPTDKTWVNVVLDILENPTTGQIEAYLSLLDIQKQKQTEFQYKVHLEAALTKAEKASMAKGNFLSMMSHEIRTPMNVIIGFTDLALDECREDAIAEYLKKIKFSSGLLLGLINDILDMSKLESRKLDLNCETVQAKEFISRLVELIKPQFQVKNINFVVTARGDKQKYLQLDKLRCQQIFMNIFSNAAKFTQNNGRVEMLIDTKKNSADKVLVTIKAKDNGIGMSREFLKKIFQPFEQENDARVSKYAGTGLGMAITKKLVELMEGSITVKSEKNIGTEFTIILPLTIGKAEDVKDESHLASAFDTGKLAGVHVLVAEDQPINVEIVKKLLEKQNMFVEVSRDGEECLKKFKAKPPDYYGAILMDIRMPVMDGLEATRLIRTLNRKDAKTIPIIAMTANAFVSDQAETKAAGMNAHLAKPLDPQQMYQVLAKFIDKQVQQSE